MALGSIRKEELAIVVGSGGGCCLDEKSGAKSIKLSEVTLPLISNSTPKPKRSVREGIVQCQSR